MPNTSQVRRPEAPQRTPSAPARSEQPQGSPSKDAMPEGPPEATPTDNEKRIERFRER